MCYYVCVVGRSVKFQTPYAKKKVTGGIGHSMNFTWTFSGAVDTITWALANNAVDDIDKSRGRLVYLDSRGVDVLPSQSVPGAYKGRVNGTRTGDSSSGQAHFTLYNVTNDDEGYYGCLLNPETPNEGDILDFVQLVVVGMYMYLSRDLYSSIFFSAGKVGIVILADGV